MNNDSAEIDELLLQMADYKNDYADMAAEKRFRKCSASWGAYQYLQDRMHEAWLPNSARFQLRRILKRIQVHQCREFGYAYEGS
jgi:flagellar biosynthesis chaperone FliJ